MIEVDCFVVAIASEMRNQRATLAKQKEEYFKKANVLKRELESLKQQRIELRGDSRRSPSPDSQRFLKENAKLQVILFFFALLPIISHSSLNK